MVVVVLDRSGGRGAQVGFAYCWEVGAFETTFWEVRTSDYFLNLTVDEPCT